MKKFDDIEFLSPHKKIRIFVGRFVSYSRKTTVNNWSYGRLFD